MLRSRCFAHSINRLRPYSRRFTVLAVESSADDTCAAVVTSTRQILVRDRGFLGSKTRALRQQICSVQCGDQATRHELFTWRHSPLRGYPAASEEYGMSSLHFGEYVLNAMQPQAIARALQEAELQPSDLDGIAYTRGPGMAGCLGMGYVAAHTLAATAKKPIVGVHHMVRIRSTSLLLEADGI